MSTCAEALIWETVPAAEDNSVVATVCIESITTKSSLSLYLSIVEIMSSTLVAASKPVLLLVIPTLLALSLIWLVDSSPVI